MNEASRALTRALWELLMLFGPIVLAAHLEGMRAAIFVAIGEFLALSIATLRLTSFRRFLSEVKYFIKEWVFSQFQGLKGEKR